MEKTPAPIVPGSYKGYTEGVQGHPTLYFEKGHYTQIHEDPKNIGWHPNAPGNYIGGNISVLGAERYDSIKSIEDPEMNAFVKDFGAKKYDDNSANSFFFEATIDGKSTTSVHLSRSRFQPKGGKYDDAYATTQMKSAKLAPNEP